MRPCSRPDSRKLASQAANLQALARVVEQQPGMLVAEYAPLLLGITSWRNPRQSLSQIICSGCNRLAEHGIVHRDGRLWRSA